ncbi:MAG TPA: nucleoside monophosphate kinase, partial [Kiritimatiellia bacterium]|nr:nucleoside monophosphate kinase [Kiritimatiellia bacterium]
EQARQLDAALAALGGSVRQVFLLEVPVPVIVSRLSGRRICKTCGAVYHLTNIPPKQAGVCDQCGGPLYQRPDDSEETVLNRLEVYQRQTASLIEFYAQKGLLVRINAGTTPQAATAELLARLA